MIQFDELSGRVIGAAIEVHRVLGAGLNEPIYEESLVIEFENQAIPFERQRAVPAFYKGRRLPGGYRIDLLVDNQIVVEVKAVDRIAPVHLAQTLNYMKLTGCELGLLINFHVPVLKDGIRRVVHGWHPRGRPPLSR